MNNMKIDFDEEKIAEVRDKPPKISVLMSVYNPRNVGQLMRAVSSMIRQTMQDWEMLLYDDGTEEAYANEIRIAAGMDQRIRLLRGDRNRGLAYAMNYCLKKAHGIYVARMDADDISCPTRLEKMYEFLENHPEYQWVGSNINLIDEHGKWGNRMFPVCPTARDFLKYSPYAHPSVMFQKKVLIENGGYHVMRRGEDYELFMRLHAGGYQGYNLQEELFCYREDRETYRHRTVKSQLEEVKIRFHGFQSLRILRPGTMWYVVKPMFVALMPYPILVWMKQLIRKEMYVERFAGKQTQQI